MADQSTTSVRMEIETGGRFFTITGYIENEEMILTKQGASLEGMNEDLIFTRQWATLEEIFL